MTRNSARSEWLKRNRTRVAVLSILAVLFVAALGGLETEDWFATIMQGLSVGAVTFLVASGLSLIFGLMDVLNLAHGEIFMLGAYVGWTIYTRFDTAVDVLVPLALVAAPFALLPLWRRLGSALIGPGWRRAASWGVLGSGLLMAIGAVMQFPLVIWNPEIYAESPITFSLAVDLGTLAPLPADTWGLPAILAILGVLAGSALVAIGFSAVRPRPGAATALARRQAVWFGAVIVGALVLHAARSPINEWVFGLSTTWRFMLAMVFATLAGAGLGALIEVALIRPLYERPIYQLMLTLGVGFILIEVVREIWGRPEFNMARPAAFNGTGAGCPGQGLGGFFSGCSTVEVFGGRLRVYNEGFVVLVGIVVLIAITLLLKRTRIGMIIRAGVQDSEMVEALGINVRRVFTLVFAIGSGLAALGGVLAAPSIGLSTAMGGLLLLQALIALAIGGLTSFPGAAAGAVLVGLLQQFIIRFGQQGISIPFVSEPFRPSPTLVPAAGVLLMVIVLVVLPNGLFGKSDR